MHKYLVGYMHARGPEMSYGNIVVTVANPVQSLNDIDEITAYLRDTKRLSNLTVMGLFKLER